MEHTRLLKPKIGTAHHRGCHILLAKASLIAKPNIKGPQNTFSPSVGGSAKLRGSYQRV